MEIKVNVTKEQQQAPQPAVLPQMDVLKGATGSVLAIQIGSDIYTIAAVNLISAIVEESRKSTVKAVDVNEEPANAANA